MNYTAAEPRLKAQMIMLRSGHQVKNPRLHLDTGHEFSPSKVEV